MWEALRDVSEVHAAWAHRLEAGGRLPRKSLRGRHSTGLRLLLALLVLALLLAPLVLALAQQGHVLQGVGKLLAVEQVRDMAVGRCRALQAAAKEGLYLGLESVVHGAERLLVSLRAQELGLQCGVEL